VNKEKKNQKRGGQRANSVGKLEEDRPWGGGTKKKPEYCQTDTPKKISFPKIRKKKNQAGWQKQEQGKRDRDQKRKIRTKG